MRREAASSDVVTSRSADRAKLPASGGVISAPIVVAPPSGVVCPPRCSLSRSISVVSSLSPPSLFQSLPRDILPRLPSIDTDDGRISPWVSCARQLR